MPFTMQAVGRLAHEPSLSLGNGKPWTRFRLLDSRFVRGEEVTEAVTFKAFGDLAERFCERIEKGQIVHAWGSQETQTWQGQDGEVTETVFILFHFEPGPRPRKSREAGERPSQRQAGAGGYEGQGASPARRPQPSAAPRADAPPERIPNAERQAGGDRQQSDHNREPGPQGPAPQADDGKGGDAFEVF